MTIAVEAAVVSLDAGPDRLFYAPGYLAVVASGHAEAFVEHPGDPRWAGVAAELDAHAEAAAARWAALASAPYQPVCLTLYPTLACALDCDYCFARPSHAPGRVLDPDAAAAAARLVAGHCADRGVRMTVALHGGGEPTADWDAFESSLDAAERAASDRGIALTRYVATSGVLPADRARALARRVDLVGLSCDGPPDIQDAQRGQGTSRAVERTAAILAEAGTPFVARATITAASWARQGEIAEYLAGLGAQAIRVEPVYRLGEPASPGFTPAEFFGAFLRARRVAGGLGVAYEASGSRLGQVHGPYCNVLRDVLQLVPPGEATACFGVSDADSQGAAHLRVGRPARGVFEIDADAVARLRANALALASGCASCVSRWHCSRGCPGACPAREPGARDAFGCAVNRLLTEARLRDAARRLRESAPREPALGTPLDDEGGAR